MKPTQQIREVLPGERMVREMLRLIGDDPKREGLIETPHRVAKSWRELFSGYNKDPASVLKTFAAGGYDQIVLLKDIEMYSTCEHHLQPFVGKAHIAYIPNGRVVGISKLARLLEIIARRLQIQERIGEQVTTALMTSLGAKGAACVIEAKHFCMCARGVGKQNSIMVTSSIRGVFREDRAARAELMGLLHK